MRDLKKMAADKITAHADAKKAAADALETAERKKRDRAQVQRDRLGEIYKAASAKAVGVSNVTVQLGADAITIKFSISTEVLTIRLADVGDDTVDICGYAKLGDRQWDFYFRPNGTFVSITFRSHPVHAPHSGNDDKHPNGPAQFKSWAVDMAKASGPIMPEVSQATVSDVLEEAIATLIEQA